VRLHSAIGYVTPQAKLEGKDKAILAERDRKLEAAREARNQKRLAQRETPWTARSLSLHRIHWKW
jgi:putative transposase